MHRCTQILLALCFSLLLTTTTYGQIPRKISYQGVLYDAAKQPWPSGSANFTFSLWISPNFGAPAADQVWPAGAPVSRPLQITNGCFSVVLGEIDLFPPTLCFDKPLYLEIKVNGTALGTQRVELLPTPYALGAVCADNAKEAEHAKDADNAKEAEHAKDADNAKEAEHAKDADNAKEAEHAKDADNAKEAVHAKDADNAFNGVPVGTIIAFYGDAPESGEFLNGWLLCNGQPSAGFPKLQQLIGNNVPDLRAMFLRGANAGRNDQFADPDVTKTDSAGRFLSPSGHAGSLAGQRIGSVQTDTLGSHAHGINPRALAVGVSSNPSHVLPAGPAQGPNPTGYDRTNDRGGSETRPNNVYINWLIKAR